MPVDLTQNRAGKDEAIVRLFHETFAASEGEEEGALIGTLARELLADTPLDDIAVFLATDGEAIVGSGIFTRLTYPEDARTVFILSPMAVATGHQKQGIGQRLLTDALTKLRDMDVEVALTYGDPAFYGQVGFQPISPDQAAAPLPLSFPHGWIGQSLTGETFPTLKGPSHCVPALNRPELW